MGENHYQKCQCLDAFCDRLSSIPMFEWGSVRSHSSRIGTLIGRSGWMKKARKGNIPCLLELAGCLRHKQSDVWVGCDITWTYTRIKKSLQSPMGGLNGEVPWVVLMVKFHCSDWERFSAKAYQWIPLPNIKVLCEMNPWGIGRMVQNVSSIDIQGNLTFQTTH